MTEPDYDLPSPQFRRWVRYTLAVLATASLVLVGYFAPHGEPTVIVKTVEKVVEKPPQIVEKKVEYCPEGPIKQQDIGGLTFYRDPNGCVWVSDAKNEMYTMAQPAGVNCKIGG